MKKGFTLLELLLVVTVILILLGLVTVVVSKAISSAESVERKTAIDNVTSALIAYRQHYGYFPESDGDGSGSASIRYVDGGSHQWYYPVSSFSGAKSTSYRSVSTVDSADLFFALESISPKNPDSRQFIDASILYTKYNGDVMTLQKARDSGATSPLRLGLLDKNADEGISWFGVAIRLDVDSCYVTLPVQDDGEWVYNNAKYDD